MVNICDNYIRNSGSYMELILPIYRLKVGGATAERDICQFIPFRKFGAQVSSVIMLQFIYCRDSPLLSCYAGISSCPGQCCTG